MQRLDRYPIDLSYDVASNPIGIVGTYTWTLTDDNGMTIDADSSSVSESWTNSSLPNGRYFLTVSYTNPEWSHCADVVHEFTVDIATPPSREPWIQADGYSLSCPVDSLQGTMSHHPYFADNRLPDMMTYEITNGSLFVASGMVSSFNPMSVTNGTSSAT